MPLPHKVDQMIRKRFADLLAQTAPLVKYALSGVLMPAANSDYSSRFEKAKVNLTNLIKLLSAGNNSFDELIEDVRNLGSAYPDKLHGMIAGLKSDYEAGILQNITDMIEANVAADYLGQAEQLLDEGQPGKYDHVPAAVLSGAILEDALRRLCQRQTPPINTHKSNGGPKTLDPLITDLQKANVFNKAKADQLKSWAKTRNYAAHGEFGEFSRVDVEQMLVGVKIFLADYL